MIHLYLIACLEISDYIIYCLGPLIGLKHVRGSKTIGTGTIKYYCTTRCYYVFQGYYRL